MSLLNEASLPNYLRSMRWFGGKARTIERAALLEHGEFKSPLSPHTYLLDLVRVQYAEGLPEQYLLATFEDSSGQLQEAVGDEHFAAALLDVIRTESRIPFGSVEIRGERIGFTRADDEGPTDLRVRSLNLEQSNSSMVLGEKWILKLLRKIEAGIHPEYEIGKVLTERGFKGSPRLCGALQLEGPFGTTVAVVHEFLPHRHDGFRYVQEALASSEQIPATFLKDIGALGKCTGELHRVLGSITDSPSFAPEPLRGEDFQRWSASIIGELGVTLALAKDRLPELAALHDLLTDKLTHVAHVHPSGMAIRIHGDFHLGQTLRTEHDWKIFDFEGEPARSLAPRREKHSPLKDVAGMIRSFAYAEMSVGLSRGERIQRLREAFLDAYIQSLSGTSLLPTGETFNVLLEGMELEKLLYELRYELLHRPDWVRIPAEQLKSFPTSYGSYA